MSQSQKGSFHFQAILPLRAINWENQAVFDNLTGFMNRPGFSSGKPRGNLERARRVSTPLSLIALDIDNFKIINDTFGIETGDEVLRVVAQAIREKSRPDDCIGRWMGDEFVILLSCA